MAEAFRHRGSGRQLSGAGWAKADFAHPGVAHSSESIAFVRARIEAREQPWARAWKQLSESGSAQLDWQPKPRADVERGPYNNPNIGSSEFSADAAAAYVHALCWVLTGKAAHAEKSAEILDAWSATLQSISNHDARLLVGMSGYTFTIAAELLSTLGTAGPRIDRNVLPHGARSGTRSSRTSTHRPTATGTPPCSRR